MAKRFQIPSEWWAFEQTPAHFVTYYGDIYHGRIIQDHFDFPDRIFILSNNQSIEFRELKPADRTLENYQRLAWEIKDKKIIRDVIPDTFIGHEYRKRDTSRSGDQIWKRAFVFGAGASAFCTFNQGRENLKNSPLRPPTAYEVFDSRFDEIIAKYPGLKLVIPRYEAMERDIEACMEKDWESIRNSYNPSLLAQHIQILFYLQEQFREISDHIFHHHSRYNLYSEFVNKLNTHLHNNEEEKAALISFNYDTILDQVISHGESQRFHSMDDYTDWKKHQLLLFKPHGSCNWGWRVENQNYKPLIRGRFSEWVFQEQKMLNDLYFDIIGKPFQTVNHNSWGIETSHNKDRKGKYTIDKDLIDTILPNQKGHYFPAILLPYRDKDEFVMPLEQQHQMKWYLSEVEELYLIGWKGNEDLFNRILKVNLNGRLKKLIIVNPEKEAVLNNLKPFIGHLKFEVEHIPTFEEFVLKRFESYLNQK